MKFTGERVVPTGMHRNIDTYQQHLVRYVWALPYVVNKVVIDGACGTGYGTNLLSTIAKEAIGLDISEDAVRYAQRHYDIPNFHRTDLNNNLNDSLVGDVIVSFETIEHLKDPKKFLKDCKKHFPRMVGSIPITPKTQYHLHEFDTKKILNLLNSIGYSNLQIWYQFDFMIDELEDDLASVMPMPHGMYLFVGDR